MGKFVVKESAKGFMFNLKAGNGEVIGVSEVYASRSGLRNGIKSVIKNSRVAKVEDQTVEGYEKVMLYIKINNYLKIFNSKYKQKHN